MFIQLTENDYISKAIKERLEEDFKIYLDEESFEYFIKSLNESIEVHYIINGS